MKASEVVRSELYHFGYTLRFPRVEKVRYEKSWDDCLTTHDFAEIIKVLPIVKSNTSKIMTE